MRYFGEIWIAGCLTAVLLTKAALEAGYFKDRKGAKQTLFCWLLSVGFIGVALGFSLLIDHLR